MSKPGCQLADHSKVFYYYYNQKNWSTYEKKTCLVFFKTWNHHGFCRSMLHLCKWFYPKAPQWERKELSQFEQWSESMTWFKKRKRLMVKTQCLRMTGRVYSSLWIQSSLWSKVVKWRASFPAWESLKNCCCWNSDSQINEHIVNEVVYKTGACNCVCICLSSV